MGVLNSSDRGASCLEVERERSVWCEESPGGNLRNGTEPDSTDGQGSQGPGRSFVEPHHCTEKKQAQRG